MCGIFGLIGYDNMVHGGQSLIEDKFNKGYGRGPEKSSFELIKNKYNT